MIDHRRAVEACRACPRLVAWREEVARVKRASFADQEYWGRPVSGFGDRNASIVLLGLAPAAHGANRTGRVFTGDRSGNFLYAALWRAGMANQPQAVSIDDGLTLAGAWVTAAVRCAPPANKPTPEERDTCAHWLDEEFALLPDVRVVVCLGGFGWDAALALHRRLTGAPARPKPKFGHGHVWQGTRWSLVGCYHPSQQNTFTGRLTEAMIDDVLRTAKELAAP